MSMVSISLFLGMFAILFVIAILLYALIVNVVEYATGMTLPNDYSKFFDVIGISEFFEDDRLFPVASGALMSWILVGISAMCMVGANGWEAEGFNHSKVALLHASPFMIFALLYVLRGIRKMLGVN